MKRQSARRRKLARVQQELAAALAKLDAATKSRNRAYQQIESLKNEIAQQARMEGEVHGRGPGFMVTHYVSMQELMLLDRHRRWELILLWAEKTLGLLNEKMPPRDELRVVLNPTREGEKYRSLLDR